MKKPRIDIPLCLLLIADFYTFGDVVLETLCAAKRR
jgi:hypothetical protein